MTKELIDNLGKRLGLIILLGQEIMYVPKDIILEYIISPGELVMHLRVLLFKRKK